MVTAKWVAQDAGIGAGVDSYFEYLVKGAILLQDKELMSMFLGEQSFSCVRGPSNASLTAPVKVSYSPTGGHSEKEESVRHSFDMAQVKQGLLSSLKDIFFGLPTHLCFFFFPL